MALSAGSVIIDSTTLTHSGSGLALAIYESALLPQLGSGPISRGVKRIVLPMFAAQATGLATAIVDYLKANAEVTIVVKPADDGLQRTPNPNTASTATLGPSSQVTLSTKGTIA